MAAYRDCWQSDDGAVTLYLGDCLEILPTLSGIDAVVTDPPYGMNLNVDFSGFTGFSGPRTGNKYDQIKGDDKPFDARHLLIARRHVIWGAQYFCHSLPQVGGWIVFNKRGDGKPSEICFGDCELAWSDAIQSVRMYSQIWHGVPRWSSEGRLHPMQKPAGLMAFCIEQTRTDGTVCDPYMGSGTTGVACVRTGRKFIGIEIEPKYFEIAKRRIQAELERFPLLEKPARMRQRELAEVCA